MAKDFAGELQRPSQVDPLLLKEGIDRRLDELGYKETRRRYSLSTDMDFVYNRSIAAIQTINQLIETDQDSSATVSRLREVLRDLSHHIKSSERSLYRLEEHIYTLDDPVE
jgi:hypothetical protein